MLEPSTPYVHGRHIDVVCDHLEAVAKGQLLRLIINIPPAFMKSLLVGVFFPMWLWGPGGRPGERFLGLSHEETLATRDNLKCRRLAQSEWFQALWGDKVTISSDQNQKTYFENTSLGYRQVATFDNVTGRRGDLVLLDDPISVKRANSEVERNTVNLWFQEALPSRVNNPDTSAIVLMMQRVHESDPTGFIMANEWGWEHLMLPMRHEVERSCVTMLGKADWRSEEGELLFPERFSEEAVTKLENQLGDYGTAGQLQQRPAPREGGMFKIDNIGIVDFVPAGAIHVRGWDIAGSSRKSAPYTVGLRLAYKAPLVYIVDVQRERVEIDKAEALILRTAHEDGLKVEQSIPQDPGQAGKAQRLHLANQLAGLDFHFSTESGEKADRAIPFASMVNAGSVRMVKAKWNSAFIEEARNFPGSTYKDQIDAASRAFQRLARHMAPKTASIGEPIYPV